MSSSSSEESLILALEALMGQKKKKQKTFYQRQKQRERNMKKRELNHNLSILPGFQPLKPYRIIFINYMSAFFVILRLIERAYKTVLFSIDTETDDTSDMPALIQIEFIQFDSNEEASIIVVFEMCQLPDVTSTIYPQVQKLVNAIFHPSKKFLSWDNEKQKLYRFTDYNLFTSSMVQHLHVVNIQNPFKNWYNTIHKHNEHCPMALFNNNSDDPRCLCSHRPYKNPNETWSLQLAIAHTFEQFLDKSSTRSDWGQGLDLRLYQNMQMDAINYNATSILTDEQNRIRLKLIKYAVDDCLAVTRLWIAIEQMTINF